MTGIQPRKLHIWAIWFLLFIFSLADSLETPNSPSILFTYTRSSEIEQQCGSILSSASVLEAANSRADKIKEELLFMNGDWDQEDGESPLMPFKDQEKPNNNFGYVAPKKLASFWVTDASPVYRVTNAVSVSGVMEIGITSSRPFSYKPYEWTPSPYFYKQEGMSRLTILFEGIYTESNENEGWRSLCLMGNATMPTLLQDGDSWELDNQYGLNYNQQYSLVQDDQIMLVLHYPKSKGFHGEMKSLNHKWNVTYFDKVQISSRLGSKSILKFDSQVLAKACIPYPYQDELVDEGINLFKGKDSYEYCEKLLEFLQDETFSFIPNWKYIGSKDYYSEFGLFFLGKDKEANYSVFEKLKLIVESLKCEPGDDESKIKSTVVSAVFRVIEEDKKTEVPYSTFSAEGISYSSNGQLCMVGCLGLLDAPSTTCSSRICLYMPLVFSIKQRSTVFGTISSINETDSHPSLVFQNSPRPDHIHDKCLLNTNLEWSYNYTKIAHANKFRKRDKPSRFGTLLRKSFLWYPSLKGNTISDFSLLSDHLSFSACINPFRTMAYAYAQFDVLSLGSQFGRHYRSRKDQQKQMQELASRTNRIKISGHLMLAGGELYRFPLFLEGLYDSAIGEMYLVGCRDIRAANKLSINGTNVERGMDCQVEVKIKYPPGNARWLLHPKIKISMSSKRSEKDPLFFSPHSQSTIFLYSRAQKNKVLFEKGLARCFRS